MYTYTAPTKRMRIQKHNVSKQFDTKYANK